MVKIPTPHFHVTVKQKRNLVAKVVCSETLMGRLTFALKLTKQSSRRIFKILYEKKLTMKKLNLNSNVIRKLVLTQLGKRHLVHNMIC